MRIDSGQTRAWGIGVLVMQQRGVELLVSKHALLSKWPVYIKQGTILTCRLERLTIASKFTLQLSIRSSCKESSISWKELAVSPCILLLLNIRDVIGCPITWIVFISFATWSPDDTNLKWKKQRTPCIF